MNSAKVLCVGDFLVDVWWSVDTAAKNVEHAAMALVSLPEDRTISPGGVGLMASALAALNQQVAVLSVIDNTLIADLAAQQLNLAGVDTQLLRRATKFTTPIKTRYVNPNGHILMRHDSENFDAASIKGYDENYVQQNLLDFDCLTVSDYSKGCIHDDVRASLAQIAALTNRPMYVDAKPAYLHKYAGADVIKINRLEFQLFASELLREGAPIERAIQLVAERLRTPLLIVTDGAAGAYYSHKFDVTCFMPNPARRVSGNCVGAGDVFFAGIVFGFAQLAEYRAAALSDAAVFNLIQFGLAAASAYVKSDDRQFPTAQSVLNTVNNRNIPVRRIMPPAEFVLFAQEQRKTGKRIVFTNGCFDLLHSGHVELLTAAKKEGDILLVAVDADSNVSRLKGPDRPVQNAATRAGNVAALDVVDAVCVFSDFVDNSTLARLVADVRPDVLVKGADYEGKTIVGASFLSRQNPPGRVVLVPLIPNSSTTLFVNKMKAKSNE
jgi:D-beta-D-heptose 7-phosphate kinase/D-beta-D-heptose 1-phosphate adenosyltransferase